MASEEHLYAEVSVGFDSAGLRQGLENLAGADEAVQASMGSILETFESYGSLLEAAGFRIGESYGKGLKAGLAAEARAVQAQMAEMQKMLSTPPPRAISRGQSEVQSYGQTIQAVGAPGSGRRFQLQSGDQSTEYKRLADANKAARQEYVAGIERDTKAASQRLQQIAAQSETPVFNRRAISPPQAPPSQTPQLARVLEAVEKEQRQIIPPSQQRGPVSRSRAQEAADRKALADESAVAEAVEPPPRITTRPKASRTSAGSRFEARASAAAAARDREAAAYNPFPFEGEPSSRSLPGSNPDDWVQQSGYASGATPSSSGSGRGKKPPGRGPFANNDRFWNPENEDGSPKPNYKGLEQHNGSMGFNQSILQGHMKDNKEGSPVDFLMGGLSNTGKYLQYFGALSGAIALFSAVTTAISAATKEALAFDQAAVELSVTLGGTQHAADGAARGFGDIAVAAGQAPSTGVQAADIGARRLGSDDGDKLGAGSEVAKQSAMLAVLDPKSKSSDYASSLSTIAQAYNVNFKDIGKITNQAQMGFHEFGGSISETIKGVEALGPAAKTAHVPLDQLIQMVAQIQGKTGKTGGTISSELGKAFEAMLTPANQKALGSAGVMPTGDPYKDLQALAAKLPTLSEARRTQVLQAVGGRGGSVGVVLQNMGAIDAAAAKGEALPNAATERFNKLMNSAIEVAKKLGAELLNLGQHLINSGLLDDIGLLLKALTPVVHVLNDMVGILDHLPGGDVFQHLIVGAAGLYGIMRLLAGTGLGTRLAGVAPGGTATAGAAGRGAAAALAGPGLLGGTSSFGGQGLVGRTRDYVTQRREMDAARTQQAMAKQGIAQPLGQSSEGLMSGMNKGEAAVARGETRPARPLSGVQGMQLGFGAVAGVAAVQQAKQGDATGAALSAGMAGMMLATPLAGAGLALVAFTLTSVANGAKEAAAGLKQHEDVLKDQALYDRGTRTSDDTQSLLDKYTADEKTQHDLGHPSSFEHWKRHPLSRHRGGADPAELQAQAQEAYDKQQEAILQTKLDSLQKTGDELSTGKSNDWTTAFGGFGLAGAGAAGLDTMTKAGLGGAARAKAFNDALQQMNPSDINQATIGEVSQNAAAVASGAGTAATDATGQAAKGSSAALASAQQELTALQASPNADSARLSAMTELVQSLTNQQVAAVNARVKAIAGLQTSFRAQDDIMGKHSDNLASLRTNLANDVAAHGAGSDAAVADQTALNQELQAQIADQAAITGAKFQNTADPRNDVDVAATSVALSARAVQNSTPGSLAFYQAQGQLRQAQMQYAQTVAEAQASEIMSKAAPGSPIEQAAAKTKADQVRLAALLKPLPKLASLADAKGLGLDDDPKVSGITSGAQFVAGITSTDYTSVGAGIAANLVSGLTGNLPPTPTGTENLPLGQDAPGEGQPVPGGRISSGPGSGGLFASDAQAAAQKKASAPDGSGALKRAGTDITKDPAADAAIANAAKAKADALRTQILADQQAEAQLAEQAKEARVGLATALAGGSAYTSARGQIETAADQQAFLRRTDPRYQDNPAYIQAQTQAAQGQLQLGQNAEQVKEARYGLGAAQAGGGSEASAYAALLTANAQADYLKRTDKNYQQNPAYIQAQTAAITAMQSLTAALRENAKNILLLSGDISDPRFTAAASTISAQKQLSDDLAAGKAPDVINADRVGVKQAQLSQQSTTFDTNMQLAQTNYDLGRDARFANEAGRSSFSAYMSFLNTTRDNLLAIKNRTFEQQRELTAADQAIQGLTAQFSGQWNLGDIKVPTIYEVRRSVASSQASTGYSDSRTVRITINGANKAEIVQVLKDQLGTAAMGRVTTGKVGG